jgi:hypothetical protein
MDLTKEQLQVLCKYRKSATEIETLIRQAFEEETTEPCAESPKSPRPKMARQEKSKVKSMLISFFEIKGIVNKDIFLVGHWVNSTYYYHVFAVTA